MRVKYKGSRSRQIHGGYGGTFYVGLKRQEEQDDQKHYTYMFSASFLKFLQVSDLRRWSWAEDNTNPLLFWSREEEIKIEKIENR